MNQFLGCASYGGNTGLTGIKVSVWIVSEQPEQKIVTTNTQTSTYSSHVPLSQHNSPARCQSTVRKLCCRQKTYLFPFCQPACQSPRSCLVWRQRFDRVEAERDWGLLHIYVLESKCFVWNGELVCWCALYCECTRVHVPGYTGMCLLHRGSDSWQQVGVLLCGGSGVRLTSEVKGGGGGECGGGR